MPLQPFKRGRKGSLKVRFKEKRLELLLTFSVIKSNLLCDNFALALEGNFYFLSFSFKEKRKKQIKSSKGFRLTSILLFLTAFNGWKREKSKIKVSNQARPPAELKHINKRRKRN